MTLAERFALISPFRWRLEWALLAAAAAFLVIDEQAREAIWREPATILRHGEHARAGLLAARTVQHSERVVRGEPRMIVETVVDLEWRDREGETRRVRDLTIADPIVADLGIDPGAKRWPEYVAIVYLMQPTVPPPPVGPNAEAVLPRDTIGPQCEPRVHCSLVVLDTSERSAAHEELERIELSIAYAPLAMWLALAAFLVLLGLRLAGLVHNRPSLE